MSWAKQTSLAIGLGLMLSMHAYAYVLKPMGESYPIIEHNLLSLMQARAKQLLDSGQWSSIQQQAIASAKKVRDRPTPVTGLTDAFQNRVRLFDPTVQLKQDIISPNQQILVKRGSYVNPFDFITLHKTLLFLNYDQPKQQSWLHQWLIEHPKSSYKIILVGGSLLQAEHTLHQSIYFDQTGHLTQHFGLKYLPVAIYQQGKLLAIREYKL